MEHAQLALFDKPRALAALLVGPDGTTAHVDRRATSKCALLEFAPHLGGRIRTESEELEGKQGARYARKFFVFPLPSPKGEADVFLPK